ncbi:histidine kinase [Formosa sediminum]|uniref:Histidine kinase n=1 Tax=Formosa sediminum TaxID=2594004 RepID=A0A516GUQ5_9FLAO|nr:histidine kinase [Formosa sediminum]QDO95247.1 histidine kinase [Formosa sediminum]
MTKNIKKFIIRNLLVSLYAILVIRLISLGMPENVAYEFRIPKDIFMLIYLICFNLNTEGNLFFDRYLNRKQPWFSNPKKRLILQIAVIIIWTLITIGLPFTAWYFFNGKSIIYPQAPVIIFIGSVFLLIGFISISIAINFFKQWKISLLNVKHYKQEKLKADYRVLQNQVNPHFLFNSLNVLISEIKHNPKNAENFTRKLSKVYRYVLQSKNHDLISLKKELEFIDSFIFLHKVRIGDALKFEVHILEEALQKQIPPLTLQILIENAIKHNIINEKNILKITITSENDSMLIVSNNIHSKDNVDSTLTGLSNLKKRFELLERDGFTYGKLENKFLVAIPLIEA